jgi:hypothetical protein
MHQISLYSITYQGTVDLAAGGQMVIGILVSFFWRQCCSKHLIDDDNDLVFYTASVRHFAELFCSSFI